MESAISRLSSETALRLLALALFALVYCRAARPAAGPARDAHAEGSPRAFLRRMAAVTAALLGLVAGLNYFVNPFGLYRTARFEPIVLHSRAEKMRLFRDRRPTPQVVILGSSSTFTMSPAQIEAATGHPAFNASMHGGVPRDYLAFLRYMEALGRVPRTVIVPVSVEVLRPDLPTGFEPHDPLGAYVEAARRDPLEDARWLLSWSQTGASLRVLQAERRGRGQPQYTFDPDGRGRFTKAASPLSDRVEAYLAGDWSPKLHDFQSFEPAQMDYLLRFLERCRALGVRVVAFLPPYHPEALLRWEGSHFEARRRDLLEWMQARTSEGLVAEMHDLTRLESFGGSPDEFEDLVHPNPENARRMLQALLGSHAARR